MSTNTTNVREDERNEDIIISLGRSWAPAGDTAVAKQKHFLCSKSAVRHRPDLPSVLGLFFNFESAHLLWPVVIATQWENSCDNGNYRHKCVF